jgi:hypothetical protein
LRRNSRPFHSKNRIAEIFSLKLTIQGNGVIFTLEKGNAYEKQ